MKKQQFRELIDQWKSESVVTEEQASRMVSDLEQQVSVHSSKKLVSALSMIGALALALGFLLLIAANWTTFGRVVKLIFAVLLPVIPLGLAYWLLLVRDSKRMYARAANIVGVLLIGGALALIGQIYHLESDMFRFFGLWTLLSAPFVFAFRKEENALLTLILFGVTIFFGFVDAFETWFVDSDTTLFTMSIVYLLYAFLLYRVGSLFRTHTAWSATARVMRLGAGVFGVLVLFLMTFEFYAEAVVSVFSLSSAVVSFIAFALNVLYIAFLAFALIRSYRHEEDQMASMVLRWFGIYLIVKYVTLFGSMLDTGLFFVIGGILFIAGGWFLEHKQQEIAEYMKKAFVASRTGTSDG